MPGHWEGDLILGLDSSAIGTLVERSTRFTLLHLPRVPGFGQPRVKNGPALAGHGAEAVREDIASSIAMLPTHLRRSPTWDQGTEMAQHAQLRSAMGLPISFCDARQPHHSHQALDGAARRADVFAPELLPDLAGPVHLVVLVVDALNLDAQGGIALSTCGAPGRVGAALPVAVITSTGRSAARCRSTRPRTGPDARRPSGYLLRRSSAA